MAEEKHPGGRPLKSKSVADLEANIAAYFKEMNREEDTRVFVHAETVKDVYEELDDEDNRVNKRRFICSQCREAPRTRGCMIKSGELKLRRPYTFTGLALWHGTNRQTLLNCEDRDEFLDTITLAKTRIENYASERLFDPDARRHLLALQQLQGLGGVEGQHRLFP